MRNAVTTTAPIPRLFIAVAALVAAAVVSPAHAGLYEDLGSRPGLARIVDRLFVHALADRTIAHTLDNTNMDRLKRLVVDQLCEVTGGPCQYKGRSMFESHEEYKYTQRDFNAFVEHLQQALDENGIGFRTQNRLLALLAPMQRDIVAR